MNPILLGHLIGLFVFSSVVEGYVMWRNYFKYLEAKMLVSSLSLNVKKSLGGFGFYSIVAVLILAYIILSPFVLLSDIYRKIKRVLKSKTKQGDPKPIIDDNEQNNS